jgi:hypothetical protein
MINFYNNEIMKKPLLIFSRRIIKNHFNNENIVFLMDYKDTKTSIFHLFVFIQIDNIIEKHHFHMININSIERQYIEVPFSIDDEKTLINKTKYSACTE